ncbi:MAG: SIMPL domain-containing protein [Solirubrobacterales bacterium]
MSSRLAATIVVALLGLALALPAAAAAAERVVSVSADATVKVPNDSASFGFSVVKERRKRGAALRLTSSKLRAVIAAVEKVPGVGPGDVSTGRISVRKVHRGHRAYFRVSQGIGVTLHEAARAGELIGVALVSGASGVSGPNYFVSNPAGAFGQALAVAFETAKSKASVLAAQAGSVLGPAVSIDEGEGAEFLQPNSDKAAPTGAGCVTGSPNRGKRGAKASDSKRQAKRHSKRAHAKGRHAQQGHVQRAHSPRARAARARAGRAAVQRAETHARVASRCTTSPAPTKPGRSTVTAHVHVIFELR